MMGELVFGAERGLKWAVFWAADGTGYRDGLLRKTENRGKREKRREGFVFRQGTRGEGEEIWREGEKIGQKKLPRARA